MSKIALFLLLLIAPCYAHAATLHVFLGIDTRTEDVKELSKLDLAKMKKAIKAISDGTDMKLKYKVAKGSDLHSKSIAKWLKNISVDKDDCVLFYFSGHGVGDQSKHSRWPIMWLSKKKEFMPLEVIEQSLEMKKPRLLILLCDACNHYDKIKKKGHRGIPVAKSALPEAKGLKKLFCEAKGKIIASGSYPGYPSWATDDGGVFTTGFLIALQHESMTSHPSWKHLFKKVPVYLAGTSQVPQCKLSVKE